MKPIQKKKAPKVQGSGKKYKHNEISYADTNSIGVEYAVTRAMIDEQNSYSLQYVQPNMSAAIAFMDTGYNMFRVGAELYIKGLKLIMPFMAKGFNDPAERYENLQACKQSEELYRKHAISIEIIEKMLK